MKIQPSSDWILYKIKLNFSKFDSSKDENNNENNDENQTSEESTGTESMFNTVERIYIWLYIRFSQTIGSVVQNSVNSTLIFGGLIDMIDWRC